MEPKREVKGTFAKVKGHRRLCATTTEIRYTTLNKKQFINQ
jgi:hypothetical protein